MMAKLRPFFVLPPLVLATLLLLPVQALAVRFNWSMARKIPILFHRMAGRALGVRVRIVGEVTDKRPLLIVSNHVSWMDVIVLGQVMPLSFIAKAEVAGWPVFGFLSKLQRTVFVERERRTKTAEQAGAIADRLSSGDAMVLFAEGTTGDGNMLLPFRSALLGAARTAIDAGGHAHVMIQPVALAYTRLHGMPLGRNWRPHVAWIGDDELMPHLMAILREGAIDVSVVFGEPITFDATTDRKAVTAASEKAVRQMLSTAIQGRG